MTATTLTASSALDHHDHLAQARCALANANRTRSERAHVRRDVREGTLTLAEIAAERPAPLRAMPLFVLLLELPGFGCRRLDGLNRRAIADGINLARTLQDAAASTLDWLVRAVDGQAEDDGSPSQSAALTPDLPAGRDHRRLLHGVVGYYHAADGHRRRLVFTAADDQTPVLIDRGDDERVVERFGAAPGLLEVAAVAGGYLDEARRLGRPAVAARDTTTSDVAPHGSTTDGLEGRS